MIPIRNYAAEHRAARADAKTTKAERDKPSGLKPIRVIRVPRNASCVCGSGKPFKRCCKELAPLESVLPAKLDRRKFKVEV